MATKICCTCKQEKPVECFSRNKSSKDGFKEYCKECAAIKSAEYRKKHKEEIRDRKKVAYEKAKETADKRTIKELEKGSKVCTMCGKEKPISDFYKKAEGGFRSYCKDCAHKKCSDYYYHTQNWFRIHKRKLEYDKEHKEEISAYNKQYYLKKSDEVKRRAREWKQNNIDAGRENGVMSTQRGRSKKNGLKATFTKLDWQLCKAYFGKQCAYCGKETKSATQDHFVSVKNGGEYTYMNIVPVCRTCNQSKGNKDFHEWYRKQPFYSKEREDNIKAYFELVEQANTERAT